MTRSTGLDLVRLLGLLAIVVGHTFSSERVRLWTYTWHVPVFFVLTGFLWTPGRSLAREARARVRSLLVPYLVWLVVVLGLYVVVFHGHHVGPGIRGALKGGSYAARPWTAFWFVTALFFAVLVYRLLERLPAPLFVAAVLGGYAASVVAGPDLAKLPLSIGTSCGVLVFIGFGQLLRKFRSRLPAVATGLLLIGLSAVLIGSGLSQPLGIKTGDFGTPVVSVGVACAISTGLILLAESLDPKLPHRARVIVSALAPALLVVVLFHSAVLMVLVDGTRPQPGVPAGLYGAVAAAFLLPLALGAALARSPLARLTTGRSRT